MKKLLLALILILIPSLALAGEWGIRGGGGAAFLENNNSNPNSVVTYDNGWTAHGEAVYKHNRWFMMGVEYLRLSDDKDKRFFNKKSKPMKSKCYEDECSPKGGKLVGAHENLGGSRNQDTFMLNAYLIAPINFPVKPYIGAGVGINDRLQGMTGFEFPITRTQAGLDISGFIQGRYFTQNDYDSWSTSAGVRILLP